jgi:hypothetical protein
MGFPHVRRDVLAHRVFVEIIWLTGQAIAAVERGNNHRTYP